MAHRIEQVLKENIPAGSEPLVTLPLSVAEQLTNEDLLLTEQGLAAVFSESYLLDSMHNGVAATVVIPYAKLRPLVRPSTPLARLLRARGLW